MSGQVSKSYKKTGFLKYSAFLTCLLLLLPALLSGCGKKADPVPMRYSLPAAVSDLRLEKKESGIQLTWSCSETTGGRFKIFRSEQLPQEACVDCPKNFSVILDLATDDSRLMRDPLHSRYSWLDVTATAEKVYSYRIVVCNSLGFCSEPSAVVDAPQ